MRVGVCVYIYIYRCWPTVVKSNQKVPFSIATAMRCRGECYSFSWIASLTLDPYLIMQIVKQGGTKYHFLSFWYNTTWDSTPVFQTIGEHCDHYANKKYIYIYIYILNTIYIYQPLRSGRI